MRASRRSLACRSCRWFSEDRCFGRLSISKGTLTTLRGAGAVRGFARALAEKSQPFADLRAQTARSLHQRLASAALGAMATAVKAEREDWWTPIVPLGRESGCVAPRAAENTQRRGCRCVAPRRSPVRVRLTPSQKRPHTPAFSISRKETLRGGGQTTVKCDLLTGNRGVGRRVRRTPTHLGKETAGIGLRLRESDGRRPMPGANRLARERRRRTQMPPDVCPGRAK